MADRFTEEEIEGFRKAFVLLDREGNGFVPLKKIGILLRSTGENPTESNLGEIINEFHERSHDPRPAIDFSDFLIILSKIRKVDDERDFKDVFDVFDSEHTGFLKTNELRAALTFLTDEVIQDDIDEMINDFDLDGDGEVSYEEFTTVMEFPLKRSDNNSTTSST